MNHSVHSVWISALLTLGAPLGAQTAGRQENTALGLQRRPDGGGAFLLDPHRGGRARELRLEEVVYGRLVDVHALDASGRVDPMPILRDFLVGETVLGDGRDYLLYTSPVTQVTHLVVLRRRDGLGHPGSGRGFDELLREAEEAVVRVSPATPDAPRFTAVPRNAAMGLRFSDLLEDDSEAALGLTEAVRIVDAQGHPVPARVRFDPNHGGLSGGAFHSTRVLVDPSVSAFEAGQSQMPIQVNLAGLPEGSESGPDFVLLLPTRLDPGSGRFARLTNRAGQGLSVPAGALDLRRAARTGSRQDAHGGYLIDVDPPHALGTLALQVSHAVVDPSGTPGFDFLVDWSFTTPCKVRPQLGDALEVNGLTLELVARGPEPSLAGAVLGARVHLAQAMPVAPAALLGNGALAARLRRDLTDSPCWFQVLPPPALPPGEGLATASEFRLRFSEPMDPSSLDPFGSFRAVRGDKPADAENTVVAAIQPSVDLTRADLVPTLPLAHEMGDPTAYRLEVQAGSAGPRDLAGNALRVGPVAKVRIASAEPSETSGGLVLRFSAPDEVPGTGADLRGNVFYDLAKGRVRGRPAAFFSAPVDRTQPVPSLMIPFPSGVQSPLVPLGSKLHGVWRYCDAGWSVRDESKYDVDVVGIAYSPVGGVVISDFFPRFEIRLAHGRRLPDEKINPQVFLPSFPASGLVGSFAPFDSNILDDPNGPQTVVHPATDGFTVSPADLFTSETGLPLLPFPINREPGPLASYTWRDTSVLAKGAPNGAGIPLAVETGDPLHLEPASGVIAPAGAVPSIGLPLLMEYRCYPSSLSLGLNAFDVSLAVNSSAFPSFRSYSSGGVSTSGQAVSRDPDLQTVPQGGFNPSSTPLPGAATPGADNVFFLGQLELAYRVSRAHSAWFDTGARAPDYAAILAAVEAGGASGVQVEFRGATSFEGTLGLENDATALDAYGELSSGEVRFLGDDPTWHASVDAIDGARFLQLRLSFVNDLDTGASPELDSLAIAFRR